MSKIPCRKCKVCGLFNDVSVTVCECETDLQNIPALLIETDNIPPEQYGEVNERVCFFVQKCSACGALNFTADKNNPVKVCCNCHKTRVAAITPVEFDNRKSSSEDDTDPMSGTTSMNTAKDNLAISRIAQGPNALGTDNDDDDDDDDDSVQWQGLLGNIRKSIGASAPTQAHREGQHATEPRHIDHAEADDDDEEGVSDWSSVLETNAPRSKKQITLTAIRYGSLSFTVSADPSNPYLLGRSAQQSAFLSRDIRVSNEHCFLIFREGFWYVKDNHSSNGTAVNSKDIGLNGERILTDGDELKLGHESDSMAFRITIT